MSASSPGVLLTHPGIGPFVQQTARALYEADLLSAYVTSFAYRPGRLGTGLRAALSLFTVSPESWLSRRAVTEVPDARLITHPFPELIRTASSRALGAVATDVVWEITERWFDRTVAARHVDGLHAVYGYEHAALNAFRAQKARHGLCIYEMPISHHATTQAWLQPEFDRYPELFSPYQRHLARQAPRRNARKDAELGIADFIVVNSSFTRDSLLHAGVREEKIAVIPLGAPPVVPRPARPPGSPFVFLSAGSQSVRKGTHYLLEAWRKLRPGANVELWLVGSMQLPPQLLADLPGVVEIRPGVSREVLSEFYQRASTFVFPSLAEGFGMVITEAMAHGLPVITTPNTAGPEFIRHGVNGFLIPPRDSDALASHMEWCVDHPEGVAAMGAEATAAVSAWQWHDYRSGLAGIVQAFLAAH